jgi:hypothetical protein
MDGSHWMVLPALVDDGGGGRMWQGGGGRN